MKPQIVVIGPHNKYSAYKGKELKERILTEEPLSVTEIDEFRRAPTALVNKLLSEGDTNADSPGPAPT